jgi:hypothetical protein
MTDDILAGARQGVDVSDHPLSDAAYQQGYEAGRAAALAEREVLDPERLAAAMARVYDVPARPASQYRDIAAAIAREYAALAEKPEAAT